MIDRDLIGYIQQNWMKHLQYISELSKEGKNSRNLVNMSSKMAFDFDTITDSMSLADRKPTSVDMLDFNGKWIIFTEFKSGFYSKINSETFVPQKCPYISNHLCLELKPFVQKCRDLEKDKLKNSIVKKALETYIVLHALILPKCKHLSDNKFQHIKYVVVFDNDPIDSAIRVSKQHYKKTQEYQNKQSIKQSLKRFINGKNIGIDDFYYDAIEVYNALEYESRHSAC